MALLIFPPHLWLWLQLHQWDAFMVLATLVPPLLQCKDLGERGLPPAQNLLHPHHAAPILTERWQEKSPGEVADMPLSAALP